MEAVNSVFAQGRTLGAAAPAQESQGRQVDTDMFLQLLITQLRYQDPMSGNQDTGEFLTQLALFTLLEQVTKLKQAVETQGAGQDHQRALGLLNQNVSLLAENGSVAQGAVTAVDFRGSEPYITVNGAEYRLSALLRVESDDAARQA
ncbi:MAG: hypothetical protein KGZ32_00130 [Dethiobacter sp.]|jgi:flagellar basal-body rod modification protein FlgD|nr:hypothetical protein [Dethiobacter sp.]